MSQVLSNSTVREPVFNCGSTSANQPLWTLVFFIYVWNTNDRSLREGRKKGLEDFLVTLRATRGWDGREKGRVGQWEAWDVGAGYKDTRMQRGEHSIHRGGKQRAAPNASAFWIIVPPGVTTLYTLHFSHTSSHLLHTTVLRPRQRVHLHPDFTNEEVKAECG